MADLDSNARPADGGLVRPPDMNTRPFVILAIGVALLATVLCTHQLGTLNILAEHEALVAQTAREMMESGDWVVPTYGQEPRLRKTPLPYWSVAIAATLTGKLDALSARLPGSLCGIGTVLCTMWLGTMLFNRRAGIVIGLVTASSTGLFWYSHEATADIQLTFWSTWALALAWRGLSVEPARHRRLVMLAAYVALAIALYAKAPIALVVVVAPLMLHPLLTGQPKALLRLHLPLGVVMTAALLLPWFIAVYLRTENAIDVWLAESFGRVAGTLREREDEPLHFYLRYLFIFALPWALSVPEALLAPLLPRYREHRRELLFVWLWLVVSFVFFTVSPFKRAHYLLPAIPAMCILIGVTVDRLFLGRITGRPRAHLVAILSIVAVLATALIVGLFALPEELEPLRHTITLTGLMAVAGVALAGALFVTEHRPAALCWVVATTAALYLVAIPRFTVWIDDHTEVAATVAAIEKHVPAEAKLYWLLRQDARVIFYANRVIPRFDDVFLSDEEWAEVSGNPGILGNALDRRLRDAEPVYILMDYWHFDWLAHTKKPPARLLCRLQGFEDDPVDDRVIVTNVAAAKTQAR